MVGVGGLDVLGGLFEPSEVPEVIRDAHGCLNFRANADGVGECRA
jgi:hypothetical protein